MKKIHLWLGLASGLVVFIVAITGCIYVFEKEIRSFTEPWQFVKPQTEQYIRPSEIDSIATRALGGLKPVSVNYMSEGKSAVVAQYDQKTYWLVYINPYSGDVLKVKNMNRDFFRIIILGHYYLWLPGIGNHIVAWSTLVFVIALITGLVLWWPKRWNASAIRGAFKISWKSGFSKLNHDLHNVLGFYSLFFCLILALTGLVWGFEWFSKSSYWLTTRGKDVPGYAQPVSDTTFYSNKYGEKAIDKLFYNLHAQKSRAKGAISFNFPTSAADVIGVTTNPDEKTYYKMETRYFDQFSLKELKANTLFAGTYKDAEMGEKLRRMNYDIHTGAIWGLTGKILAFFASLIAASLPVTGFYIWWKKRNIK